MPSIKLKSLFCILPDEIDKDEVFLKYNGKKIWPEHSKYKQIDSNEKTEVNITIDHPDGWLEIELWDYDLMSANDKLGFFKMKVDDQHGSYSASLQHADNSSKASYLLEWAVM